MDYKTKLYPTAFNPLLIKPERPLPKEVAVIGAGAIGPDIGYYFKAALPEIKLFLVDIVEEQLKKAEKRLQGYAEKAVALKKMREDEAKRVLENITYTTGYSQIKNCDLVVEAATENIPIKQSIFAQVEEIVSKDTIITSNTSSIPAERIFLKMKRPERSTVTHFFAPAWRNPAVEVIRWDKAEPKVVDYLFWMFCVTGKVPIISDNALCFIIDRPWDNYCNECAYLTTDATTSQIDKVAEEELVAVGPFYVINMARGNPIIYETNLLQMEEGKHYKPALILKSVDIWQTIAPGTKLDVPEDIRRMILDRLLGVIFSQSFDIIDRGIGTLEDLNLGLQVALAFKKGPFDIMRDLGEKETKRILKKFQKERGGFPGMKKSFATYQDFKRHVLVDNIDGVRIITLRRPQFMNALSDEVNNEIMAVMQEGENDPEVKGFIITGYGPRAFCAGAEIGRFPEVLGNAESSAKYTRDYSQLLHFIDQMNKPVVAAVNGMALGGGFELALRSHSAVATKNATFQFPEVTLGILPGSGGCVVPYRKWPASAAVFHEMLCLAKPFSVKEATDIGIVKKVVDNYFDMIQAAIEEVNNLQGKVKRIPDGKVDISEIKLPEQPMAGKLVLSKEAVSIIAETIKNAAAATSFRDALEIGYRGMGKIACTEAAKEGISAFLEKRQPVFKK